MPNFFHGSTLANLERILSQGIRRPNTGYTADTVSLALRPDTARAYAAMGGESGFRAAGAKARTIPIDQRALFQVNIPEEIYKANLVKELYRGEPLHEVRLGMDIPPEYISHVPPESYNELLQQYLLGKPNAK